MPAEVGRLAWRRRKRLEIAANPDTGQLLCAIVDDGPEENQGVKATPRGLVQQAKRYEQLTFSANWISHSAGLSAQASALAPWSLAKSWCNVLSANYRARPHLHNLLKVVLELLS